MIFTGLKKSVRCLFFTKYTKKGLTFLHKRDSIQKIESLDRGAVNMSTSSQGQGSREKGKGIPPKL